MKFQTKTAVLLTHAPQKNQINVGKTNTDFDAYAEESGGVIATTGATFTELRQNMLDAYNAHDEYHQLQLMTADDLAVEFALS